MAITATTTTASTIRITIGFLLRAGPPGARRAARLNAVEMALVAGVGGVGNLKGKGGGNIDVLFAVPAVPAQLRGRPMTPDRRTGRAPRLRSMSTEPPNSCVRYPPASSSRSAR